MEDELAEYMNNENMRDLMFNLPFNQFELTKLFYRLNSPQSSFLKT